MTQGMKMIVVFILVFEILLCSTLLAAWCASVVVDGMGFAFAWIGSMTFAGVLSGGLWKHIGDGR